MTGPEWASHALGAVSKAMRRFFSRAGPRESPLPPGLGFWAFISYSHADEVWAKWLHEALERYRLPEKLVGRPLAVGVVPQRLRPVFRDRDELPGSSSLKQEIARALERSRALVVICSPNSAVSRYVNEEILIFKRLGREADIYCLLVAGEPNATDEPASGLLEAFPPAIRFRVGPDGALTEERAEPLAADVRKGKDARTDAKLKLLAGILGIGFDELKRRDARRRTRQRAQLSAIVLSVLLVIFGVWWNRQRAFESKRQVALAQRLADQSAELLASEQPYLIERAVLLLVEALKRLDRPAVDFSEDGEAAQARLAADQGLRRALSLFYTHAITLQPEVQGSEYEDRGWARWTASAIVFSPDGREVIAANAWDDPPGAAVKRWQLRTGRQLQSLKKSLSETRFDWGDDWLPCALSPDGGYLAVTSSAAQSAIILDLRRDREVARIRFQGSVHALAVGPGAAYLAIATDNEIPGRLQPVQVWHVPSARPVAGLPADDAVPAESCKTPVCPAVLAFSPDARYLAIAGREVQMWRLVDDAGGPHVEPGPDLDFHRGRAVAFSADGRYIAAAGREGTAWSDGQAVDFGDPAIRVWEVAAPRAVSTVPLAADLRGLAVSPGGKYLSILDDEYSLRLRALASGRETRVHFSHPAEGGGIDIQRSRSANFTGKGPPWRGKLTAAAFSPDGEHLALAGENGPILWRITSFDEQAVHEHATRVAAVAFDRDERIVTTVSGTTNAKPAPSGRLIARAWEVESGRELSERSRKYAADAFALTRLGDLAVATDDEHGSGRGGTLIVYADEKIGPFRYQGDAEHVGLSPDGKHIAVASVLGTSSSAPVSPGRREVSIWDIGSRERVLRFDYTTSERDAGGVDGIAFRQDGWYLGVYDSRKLENGSTSRFRLWELKSRREIDERPDDVLRMLREDIALSADGRFGALESGDKIHVWAVPSENQIARIDVALADRDPFRLASTVVALSAHGRYVAAATAGTNVRIWPLALPRLIHIACSRVTRELSLAEWTQYLGTERRWPTCTSSS
jgi:WD40 repeat protein